MIAATLGASARARRFRIAFVFLAVLFAVSAFAVLGREQLSPGRIGIDDANIYFRYARNIAHGHGFVWTPGGERVEGATSFLWTLVCTAAFAMSATPEQALLWVNVVVLSLGLTAWLLGQLRLVDLTMATTSSVSRWLAVAVVLAGLGWCLASVGYVTWLTLTLLETGLWGSLLLWTSALVLLLAAEPVPRGRRWGLGFSLFLLAWARPEGLVVSVALLVFSALAVWRGRGKGPRVWSVLQEPLALVVVANGGLFLFRRLYFGFWLPNTYYAKVDPELAYNLRGGWEYFGSFVAAYPIVLLIAAAAMAVVGAWLVLLTRPPGSSVARYVTDAAGLSGALWLLGLANGIYVGGDHFFGWRFFQPYWPFAYATLLTAPLVAAAHRPPADLPRRLRRWLVGALAFAAAGAAVSYIHGPARWTDLQQTTELRREFWIAEQGRFIGSTLNDVFAQVDTPTIGVFTSGGIPFAYRGVSYDLLGLNNVAMAHAPRRRSGIKNHEAFAPSVFYQQAPDVLVVNITPCALSRPPANPVAASPAGDWLGRVIKHVHQEARFQQLYAPVVIASPEMRARGEGWCEYARRAFLERVQERADIHDTTTSSPADPTGGNSGRGGS